MEYFAASNTKLMKCAMQAMYLIEVQTNRQHMAEITRDHIQFTKKTFKPCSVNWKKKLKYNITSKFSATRFERISISSSVGKRYSIITKAMAVLQTTTRVEPRNSSQNGNTSFCCEEESLILSKRCTFS